METDSCSVNKATILILPTVIAVWPRKSVVKLWMIIYFALSFIVLYGLHQAGFFLNEDSEAAFFILSAGFGAGMIAAGFFNGKMVSSTIKGLLLEFAILGFYFYLKGGVEELTEWISSIWVMSLPFLGLGLVAIVVFIIIETILNTQIGRPIVNRFEEFQKSRCKEVIFYNDDEKPKR